MARKRKSRRAQARAAGVIVFLRDELEKLPDMARALIESEHKRLCETHWREAHDASRSAQERVENALAMGVGKVDHEELARKCAEWCRTNDRPPGPTFLTFITNELARLADRPAEVVDINKYDEAAKRKQAKAALAMGRPDLVPDGAA